MKPIRLLSLAVLLVFSLNACSEGASATPPSLAPETIPTSTVTFIAVTATVPTIFSPTPTQETTLTPEAPEINMTLEDWKKVFVGQYTSNDGNRYELSRVFRDSDLLTGEDAIRKLDTMEVGNTTTITILNPDGKVTIIAELDFAKQRVQEGACILVTREGKDAPAAHSKYILGAAIQDFENGTNKITKIEFGEITSVRFSFNPPSDLLIESFFPPIKHLVVMPKHFKVNKTNMGLPVSLAEIGITDINPDNWIDTLIDAGVKYISIYAQ